MTLILVLILLFILPVALGDGLGVEQITTNNIHGFLAGRNKKLLTFYSLGCYHCAQFAPVLEKVTPILRKKQISVGKIDVTTNQALTSWFKINAIPSVFLVVAGSVYKYEGPYDSSESVLDFALKGYRNSQALGFWDSPLGPYGTLKGCLIRTGGVIASLPALIADRFGVSNFTAYMIFILMIIISVLLALVSAVVIAIKWEKRD
jgi:thiol-disulfide isomerase/thioredoxin